MVLSGLKTTANVAVSPDPSLVVTPPFTPSTTTPTGAKTNCADILNQAKSLDDRTFLGNYAINNKATASSADISIYDKLTTFRSALSSADTGQTIADKNGYSDINTFLRNLDSTHMPVIRLVDNCLKESLQVDMTQYDSAKATAEESKSRLDSILTPEQDVSYYEGWFPIVRPMKESSLFILFGTALLFLLIAITVFLSMAGVSVQIQIPELMIPQMLNYLPPGTSYYLYSGLLFGLLATYIAFRFKYI